MLYAVTDMMDGHYTKRLVLKGGFSVRSIVPLASHRFSFDADFDSNTYGDFTYGDVEALEGDMRSYGMMKGCKTPVRVTTDNANMCFIEIGYRRSLGSDHKIIEAPKIEVCKTCRVRTEPVLGHIDTIIDTDVLGLKLPKIAHLSLEEQLATKFHVIGSSGRQRNQFDAYDSFMILKHSRPDMRKTRDIFKILCGYTSASTHAAECRRHLGVMRKNDKKRKKLENATFEEFDFDDMITTVESFYDF